MFEAMKKNISLNEAYALIRENIALVDGSVFGMLEVSGDEAADYLDTLVTRDVKYLGIDTVSECLLLRDDASVLGSAFVCRLDEKYVVLTSPGSKENVDAWIMEKAPENVMVKDLSVKKGLLFIEGLCSYKIVRDLMKVDVSMLPLRGITFSDAFDEQLTVARIGRSGEYAYALIGSESALETAVKAITDFSAANGWQCGFTTEEALEVCMTETMQPCFKLLDTAENNLFELGIQWMIQYEKEDYIGCDNMKELFAGEKPYEPVCFVSENAKAIAKNAAVLLDGEQIGKVLCACVSPKRNAVIGLAKVKADIAVSGVCFDVETADGICDLETVSSPIVRPISWDKAME